jgi:hypothetical protein
MTRDLATLKKLPWATIGFIAICVIIYESHVAHWTELNTAQQLVLHPFFHRDNTHIAGDLILGIFVVGSMIECWMTQFKRVVRCGLLIFCYVMSLIVTALWTIMTGAVPYGSSGLVLAGLGVVVLYYCTYHEQLSLKSWNALGPIGVGLMCAFLLQMVVRTVLDPTQWPDLLLHGFIFVSSFWFFYVADIEPDTPARAKTPQTS